VPLRTAPSDYNSSLVFSAVLVAALYLQAATRTEMKERRAMKLKREGNAFECYRSAEMEGTVQVAAVQ